MRERTERTAPVALACASAMLLIAQHVVARAIRDALFLTSFPAEDLPKVMLTAAAVGLVILSPLLLALAGWVWIAMGRPVLFRQARPGLGGRPFSLVKFRTMSVARTADVDDASRLTRVGQFLRSTSLDELPELWNVLRGEMSLVGPRPLLMEYLPLYSADQARRHAVRPGITGWAQVNGRNAVSWPERLALDGWYVDHLSLALDLRILWRTAAQVVRREGISQPGHATMEPFRGN